KRFAGPHQDRVGTVYPAGFAHGRRRQQTQALPGSWVDLDERHPPPRFDPLQVESRDDAVLGEAESEVRFLVQFHAGVLSEPQIRPGRFSTIDTAGSVTSWA